MKKGLEKKKSKKSKKSKKKHKKSKSKDKSNNSDEEKSGEKKSNENPKKGSSSSSNSDEGQKSPYPTLNKRTFPSFFKTIFSHSVTLIKKETQSMTELEAGVNIFSKMIKLLVEKKNMPSIQIIIPFILRETGTFIKYFIKKNR